MASLLLDCHDCDDIFDGDESYIIHLKSHHQVKKNFNHYLATAKRKVGSVNVKKEREQEVITVEDDGSEEFSSNNDSAKEDLVLDEETKEVLRQSIQNLFQPMHDLLDGKIEIEMTEKYEETGTAVNEDEIWKSFDELKSSLQNMNVAEKFLQSFIKPEKVSEEFQTPSSSRILPRNSNNKSRKPLEPVKSGQSTMSGTSAGSGRSYYQCPLPSCSFKTTKGQLKRTAIGTEHFKIDHKIIISAEMLRREEERGNAKMYQFRKIYA